jgi:hypothetical protein
MEIFLKKPKERYLKYFQSEKHPYDPDPEFPIIHGLHKNGSINWDFWLRQESWTLKQAFALIYKKHGDIEDCYLAQWCQSHWGSLIDKILGTGLEHNVFSTLRFRTTPLEKFIENYQKELDLISEVYPQPFVALVYQNGMPIPGELRSFLKDIPLSDESNTLSPSIDRSPFLQALEHHKNDNGTIRRGITAALLRSLGFRPEQVYLATYFKTINADQTSMKRKGSEFVQQGKEAMEKLRPK